MVVGGVMVWAGICYGQQTQVHLFTAIEEEWTNIPQATINNCVRQMVVTPDTDWFSDPPRYSKTILLCTLNTVLYAITK